MNHLSVVEGLIILPLDGEVGDCLEDSLEVLSNKGNRLNAKDLILAHSSVELPHAVLCFGMNFPVLML